MIRDTERKELWSNLACLRVHPVDDGLPGEEAWLIIRKDEGETKVKYQLSNAPDTAGIEKLARMSCSRYWIERGFEDAKGMIQRRMEERSWPEEREEGLWPACTRKARELKAQSLRG